MSEDNRPFYFFDASLGEVLPATAAPPKKRNHMYMVLKREALLFIEFSLKTKKKIKAVEALRIQENYVPFSGDISNIMYRLDNRKNRHFFSWVGTTAAAGENTVYEEVPESFIFKGDAEKVKDYNVFVFRRSRGYEIIYFDGQLFYSLFETREAAIPGKVTLLQRKFCRPGNIKILSEIDDPALRDLAFVDVLDSGEKCFLLHHYYPFTKVYSNVSREAQVGSKESVVYLWERYLNVLILLLLSVFLFNGASFLYLARDNRQAGAKFAEVDSLLNRSNALEFQLDRVYRRVSAYPDHLLYLDQIGRAVDKDTYLTDYSLAGSEIRLQGFSGSSLAFLNRLRNSTYFQDVSFSSPVNMNMYSKKEQFAIKLVIKKND